MTARVKRYLVGAFFVSFLISGVAHAKDETEQKPERKQAIERLIRLAEDWFYRFENPNHLDRVAEIVSNLGAFAPEHPYPLWAKARVAFWKKEYIYPLEAKHPDKDYSEEKLKLAETCHKSIDLCLKDHPDNAECHLMKGICLAMQGSTWGKTLKTLRILKPMREHWNKAIELPSDFQHMGDKIETKELATFLNGISYRIVPDSFWFWLFARVRGSKEKSYEMIQDAMSDYFRSEPGMIIELAAAALCHGQENDDEEARSHGMKVLENAFKLPVRNDLDRLDHKNLRYLHNHPIEACNYRRERFEDISEDAIKASIDEES